MFSGTKRQAVMKLWLAVDPMLNSPTETSVAGSTLSWEANVLWTATPYDSMERLVYVLGLAS